MKAESRQIPQKLAARLKFVCCYYNCDAWTAQCNCEVQSKACFNRI